MTMAITMFGDMIYEYDDTLACAGFGGVSELCIQVGDESIVIFDEDNDNKVNWDAILPHLDELSLDKSIDTNDDDESLLELRLIHLAALDGRADIVQKLLERGADPCVQTSTCTDQFGDGWGESHFCGVTPLHIAADQGYADVVEMLIPRYSNVDICANSIGGGSTYMTDKLEEIFERSFDYSYITEVTPLHLAILAGSTECIGLLLQKGANPDAECYFNYSNGDPPTTTGYDLSLMRQDENAWKKLVELKPWTPKAFLDGTEFDNDTPMLLGVYDQMKAFHDKVRCDDSDALPSTMELMNRIVPRKFLIDSTCFMDVYTKFDNDESDDDDWGEIGI